MAQFYSVNKDVLPLKANLAVMQGKYQAAKRELEAAEALLEAKEVSGKKNVVNNAYILNLKINDVITF